MLIGWIISSGNFDIRNRPVQNSPGLFNCVGKFSHSMFGVLDSENEEFYNHKISQREDEHTILLHWYENKW